MQSKKDGENVKQRLLKNANPMILDELNKCKLCKHLGSDYMVSYGSTSANIMFILRNPSTKDIKHGKAMGGATGEMFDLMLDSIDMSRDEVYITHLNKCVTPRNRAPYPNEINTCKNMWLTREISNVDPKLLVLFGKVVTDVVLPEYKFEHKLSGLSDYGIHTLSLLPPSFFLRKNKVDDFIKLGTFIYEKLQSIL